MRKNNFTIRFTLALCFLLVSFFVNAQNPPADLSGEALKSWLKQNYFDGKHVTLEYNTSRMYLYNYIDNHNNTVTCIYSGLQVAWTYGGTGTNPAPINCEHTVPQSFFNSESPMVSDLHHLFPVNGPWNSTRNNNPYGEIDDNVTQKWMYLANSQTTIPTSNIDLYSEYANSVFEPREDTKGDVARAIFYFYTMYPTQAGDISQVGDVSTLYQWTVNDPVNQTEIDRNNAIALYQKDLNPYIIYPELIERAWNVNPTNTLTTPSLQITISDATLILNWNNIANETGYKLYKSVNNANYTLLTTLDVDVTNYTDLDVTTGNTYKYYVVAFNETSNSSNSNSVSGQLAISGDFATNLFISEYTEGTGYNKAIEIANFTGQTIDLSTFSLKKQANGTGDWGYELILTGNLTNGSVYVITHNQASAEILAKANLTTSSTLMTFNGNDPIGLFQNGTQIDQVGDFNCGATNFAIDMTLVRKSTIASPTTTYTINDWNILEINDITNLSTHTFNISNTNTIENVTVSKLNVNIYPNPTTNILNINLSNNINNNLSIEIYNISGQVVLTDKNIDFSIDNQHSINISDIKSGIYFIAIKGDNINEIKKIVKN